MKTKLLKPDDDVMTVKAFTKTVRDGCFIDSDGTGFYVKDGKRYGSYLDDDCVSLSDIRAGKPKPGFTHVVWYNK